jgi:hypothetical protein
MSGSGPWAFQDLMCKPVPQLGQPLRSLDNARSKPITPGKHPVPGHRV